MLSNKVLTFSVAPTRSFAKWGFASSTVVDSKFCSNDNLFESDKNNVFFFARELFLYKPAVGFTTVVY